MVPLRPGWNQGGPPGIDLQRLAGRARRDQRSECVGLGVEGIHFSRRRRPVPPDAGGLGQPAAYAGGGGELILRPVAPEDLSDLEQSHVAETAIGVALRGRNQPGDQARPHVGKLGCNRIGERQLRPRPPEQFGLRPAK